MPAPELWGRFQKAVLWVRMGYDRNGQPVVSAHPIEINVRWDDTYRQVASPKGTPTVIEAVAVVDRDIPIGSLMWLGTLASLPGTGSSPTQDVMEVHSFNGIPDLKNRVEYREVNLKRFKNVLGTTR